MTEGETERESALFSSLLSVLCVSEQSGTQQHNRGRSHIAPKNARRAAFSFFFQSARAVALRRRLSLLSNHQLRSPLQEGAVRLRHSEKLRCFYLDAARTRLEKTSASLPLWVRIPRFYIWNNELERAKDAICERPLNLYVCRRGALWLAYHRTQTQSATQWEFLFNPSTDIDSYYSYDTRTRQKCFIRTGYSFQPSIRLNSSIHISTWFILKTIYG